MSTTKNDLLLLFDRPMEPCFMQKGEEKVVFDLPHHYLPDKYASMTNTISNRFGNDAGRSIPVRNIALPNLNLPLEPSLNDESSPLVPKHRRMAGKLDEIIKDLSLPMELPYHANFSVFIPSHSKMASHLINIFMGLRDLKDLLAVCAYCQLHINPYMFNYCLSVTILHREDTKGLEIPTFVETFPDKFMDAKVLRRAREVANIVESGARMPITIPVNYTANETEPEQCVAYFREDIGVNLHHWHWHLVYPFVAADRAIIDKDRRGELFYYMHQQIVARFDIERLCNKLARVRRYSNFRTPLEEGYFPKLVSQVASRTWPARFPGSTVDDVDRPLERITVDVFQLETWRDRFIQAIETLTVILPDGRKFPLDEERGIDILGNMMQSSAISPNRRYYGDLHNMGHVFISLCHDPDYRHLEQFGVMADSATAMRDPAFYRWHSHVDDLFQLYKNKLTPYSNEKLDFPGVRVSSVSISGGAGTNTLGTLWEQSTVELSRGLDFTPRGSVLARFTHLQHQEFEYIIEVNNTSGQQLMGMVRIFMAPTQDESGQPLPFAEQRRLMIECDKFSAALRPGNNTVRRRSVDSSVTIPYERTFRTQDDRPGDLLDASAEEFNFCGCGWPDHLLVPKGTTEGYPMVLFVMISNWNEDWIEQDLVGSCNDAASYCGIRDRRYPDRRAMGFPFDRSTPAARTLSDFLKPNMAMQEFTVRFEDIVRPRGQQG